MFLGLLYYNEVITCHLRFCKPIPIHLNQYIYIINDASYII